ncbi:unnamed protein product [Parajaminaea phylloscopi]
MASASTSSTSAPTKSRPVVMCGPSGVGKSTLIKKLFAEFPGEYGFSVSHTTRAPRSGETPGESYHYVSRPEFEDLVSQGAFLEHAQFGGNLYGTTAKAVQAVNQEQGKRAILDIDAQGVKLLKANHAYLDPLYLFISPPNLAALYSRLKSRGTETPQSIVSRLSMAAGEMEYARSEGGKEFDVVVVNDDLERAYALFKKAIREGTSDCTSDAVPAKEEDAVLAQARREAEQ